MRPEIKTGKRSNNWRVRFGFAAAIAMLCANAGHADTAYGCTALESHVPLPAVEAKGGTFFAIRPELQAFHGFGDETIVLLSDLNAALSARGTTLVILPVPTRPQVFPHELPLMASYLGYDAATSLAVYEDLISRLENAGLTTADARQDLHAAGLAGERPFFETDPRPTTTGTRLLAKAVGAALSNHPDLIDAVRGAFSSYAGEQLTLPSAQRRQLQAACDTQLPAVSLQTFTTTSDPIGDQATEATPAELLVVLGTSITGTPELNLAGFLSEATGFDTLGYGVAKGGAFAAMSSYLTSLDFQAAPPRVLVWEVPVTASMSAYGDQPIRELIAAAANACSVDLSLTRGTGGGGLRANLSQLDLDANLAITLDTGGAAVPFVRFHFTETDGLIRTRSIYRHTDQVLTGRFYLPLSGLNANELREVEVEMPIGLNAQVRLAVCS